uniref:Uncharacterized protein n=1 Tax=Cacopsylla melanoneura TaxID=428564 RepID=A0A8D8RLB4_9HEMI
MFLRSICIDQCVICSNRERFKISADFRRLDSPFQCTQFWVEQTRKSVFFRQTSDINRLKPHCIKTALLKSCKNNIGPSSWEQFMCYYFHKTMRNKLNVDKSTVIVILQ